jgi:hypothetical protein
MHVLIVWIFNTTILEMSFLLSIMPLLVNEVCFTPLVGMRFCKHVRNSPKDKN